MPDFVMPSLGADMLAATLVKWHVTPGQAVQRGDIVAEVETEKGLIDIECFQPGVIESLDVTPGTKVPVGARMATIREDEAAAGARGAEMPAPAIPPAGAAPPPAAPVAAAPTGASAPGPATPPERPVETPHRVRVSPLARTRAAAAGIDLGTVHGTGPGGAIQAEDVDRAAAERAAAAGRAPDSAPAPSAARDAGAPAATTVPTSPAPPTPAPVPSAIAAEPGAMAPMRRAIAAAMARSKREIPHYYLATDIDMQAALAWLQAENAARPIDERMLPAVLLLKATARALREVPALNGHWVDGHPVLSSAIHLGFAVALKGGGLVAPAIHDVDEKSCHALMAELQALIPRVRAGRLRSSEMADATLTVTSLGDLGADAVLGVIYPPQLALVGFGRIRERPWAVGGALTVRPVVTASLAADHRATDGAVGARFLDALTRHLHAPETL